MSSIITIGTATRDVYLKSSAFKVVKDSHFTQKAGFPTGEAECFPLGSKMEIDEIFMTTGGGATNTAVTFARQGIHTRCLVEIGDDHTGDEIIHELQQEGIELLAIRNKKLSTAYSTLLLAPSGERTVLVYRGAANDLTAGEISWKKLSALPSQRLWRPRWAYIVPGNISFTTIEKLVNYFCRQGTKIAMNPSAYYLNMGAKKLKPLLDKINVILLNREEACFLTNMRYGNEKRLFQKLDEFIDGIAVMTEGPKGVRVSDGRNIFHAGCYKEKRIVDRTGAGDAFGSGFVAGLMQKGDFSKEAIMYAVKLASANATSKVENMGAKGGLLTKRQFEKDERWKKLKIYIQPINP